MYGEAGFVFAYAAHLRDTGTVRIFVRVKTLTMELKLMAVCKKTIIVRLRVTREVDSTRWRRDRHNREDVGQLHGICLEDVMF